MSSEEAYPGFIIEEKYQLEQVLGEGAMGQVWLANQVAVDREVAIKLLLPGLKADPAIDERFEVEAKAVAKLKHPNCITLYDFGFSAKLQSYYTAMEFIEGKTLDRRLGAPLPFEDTIELIRQISLGLDHAHFHGILHRDLKPENIMLSVQTDGSTLVKILDFGIARIVQGDFKEDSEAQRLTQVGEVFGTPAYMSPEQAQSTRGLTPASDYYALGVIFYEMIEGQIPFMADSAFNVLMKHVNDDVPPLTRPDVPPFIREAIFKLLKKDPLERFQNGVELRNALSIPDSSAQISLNALKLGTASNTETLGPDLETGKLDSEELENKKEAVLELVGEDVSTLRYSPQRKKIIFMGLGLLAMVLLTGLTYFLLFPKPNSAPQKNAQIENPSGAQNPTQATKRENELMMQNEKEIQKEKVVEKVLFEGKKEVLPETKESSKIKEIPVSDTRKPVKKSSKNNKSVNKTVKKPKKIKLEKSSKAEKLQL